jgi:general secretion pathway protein N
MTKMGRIAALATFLALAAIAMFPLRLAGLERIGITARAAEGTIWQGHLHGAQFQGIPIGDMDIQVSVASLLGGRLQTAFASDELGGTVTKRPESIGLNGLNGRTGPLLIGGLPVSAIEFNNVDIGFSERACTAPSGQVRLRLAEGPTAGAELTGSPVCDGAIMTLPLASDSGQVKLTLKMDSAGHYQATLVVDGVSEAQMPAMLVAGFRQTSTGLAMTKQGTL